MVEETQVEILRARVKQMQIALEIFADPASWKQSQDGAVPVKASIIAQAVLAQDTRCGEHGKFVSEASRGKEE